MLKRVDFIDLLFDFKKKDYIKFIYLPMQKSLNILPRSSSTSTFPTIIPKCLVAILKSSAALSKSTVAFFFLNSSK